MHLIVPFAAPLAEAGRTALASLALPQLRALLALADEAGRDQGDEWSFTPPHERVLAGALGLGAGDGSLPWAAWLARSDGVATGALPWGLLTPVHLHLGTDQVSLIDPAALMLDESASRALFDAIAPLFTSEGFAMHYGAPLRWYVSHPSLAALRTASLDRVVGRNIDRWLTDDPAVRLVRRLQNEVQMLLYTHALNDERAARGLLSVNSFWLSGCGVAPQESGATALLDDRLRSPALAGDWAAWAKAWDTLDDGPIANMREAFARGDDVRLTLAGERSAVTWVPGRGAWRRLRSLVSRPVPAHSLEGL